jgi:hypothetical protein
MRCSRDAPAPGWLRASPLSKLFYLLSFLLVVVTELVLHAVQLHVQRLIDLLAVDTVLGRADTHAGWRRREVIDVAELHFLVGLAQGPVGLGIDVGSGIDTEFLLKAGYSWMRVLESRDGLALSRLASFLVALLAIWRGT